MSVKIPCRFFPNNYFAGLGWTTAACSSGPTGNWTGSGVAMGTIHDPFTGKRIHAVLCSRRLPEPLNCLTAGAGFGALTGGFR